MNPTFDDPESFFLDIKTGVIRANIGDIGIFLNAGGVANSPLKNITLLADGDQIKLKGTLHKLISLPVELLGSITATSDNRIQLHVNKTLGSENSVKRAAGRIEYQRLRPLPSEGNPGH